MLLPVALALPHLLYAVIWIRPQWWKSVFRTKEKAVAAFEIAAAIGKGLVYVVLHDYQKRSMRRQLIDQCEVCRTRTYADEDIVFSCMVDHARAMSYAVVHGTRSFAVFSCHLVVLDPCSTISAVQAVCCWPVFGIPFRECRTGPQHGRLHCNKTCWHLLWLQVGLQCAMVHWFSLQYGATSPVCWLSSDSLGFDMRGVESSTLVYTRRGIPLAAGDTWNVLDMLVCYYRAC